MLSTFAIPHKTQYGIQSITSPSLAERKKLDLKLRHLLVLVDGQKNIATLIEKSLYPVDLSAFELLHQQGYIGFADIQDAVPVLTTEIAQPPNNHGIGVIDSFNTTPAPTPIPTTPTVSLSQVRFDALDILLDLSMEDFSVRPWIDEFEKAQTIEKLAIVVQDFGDSAIGKQYPNYVQKLKQLF